MAEETNKQEGNHLDFTFDFDEEITEEVEETEEESQNEETEEELEDRGETEELETENKEEEEGEVTTENEESENEEVTEEEPTIVHDIAQQFDLELEEDIEDDWDGVLEVTKRAGETMAQRQLNALFNQFPDIGQYAQYRMNGGDPSTYQEQVLSSRSYEDVDLSSESTQERLIRKKLQEVDGFSDEKIDKKVGMYKSGGFLKSEAEDAKDILSKKQEERQKQLLEEQKRQAKQQREQLQQQREEFRNTIYESNSLGGLRIPETKKDDFSSFVLDPVEEGVTRADQQWSNLSQESALALDYLVYLSEDGELDLSQLVDNLASTKKTRSISEKLKKTRSSKRDVNDSNPRNSRDDSGDISEIDLSSLTS